MSRCFMEDKWVEISLQMLLKRLCAYNSSMGEFLNEANNWANTVSGICKEFDLKLG